MRRATCRSHVFHVALVFSLAFCSTMYHFLQLGMDHEVKKAARATCNCLRFSGFSRAKLLREPETPKGGFSRIRSDSARELCAISVHTEKSQLQISRRRRPVRWRFGNIPWLG